MGSGFLMAIIRISDPFVYKELQYQFSLLINKKKDRSLSNNEKKKKRKVDLSKESLCSFLNSSLNVEYVYLILVGIQKFMGEEEIF